MALKLETVSATATLAGIRDSLRYQETLHFRLVSISTGLVGGQRANLVLFRNALGAPAVKPLELQDVDGALPVDQQQAALNAAGFDVVCYGSLYVSGAARNIAARRQQ